MKKLLVLSVVFYGVAVQAADFLDIRFDSFVNRVVPEEGRHEFKKFYAEYMAKIQKITNPCKREEILVSLRQKARSALVVKYPKWAQELEPFEFYERSAVALNELNPKQVRVFLTRLGVWEEYTKDVAHDKASLWQRFKDYSKTTSNKVVGIFRRNKKDVGVS